MVRPPRTGGGGGPFASARALISLNGLYSLDTLRMIIGEKKENQKYSMNRQIAKLTLSYSEIEWLLRRTTVHTWRNLRRNKQGKNAFLNFRLFDLDNWTWWGEVNWSIVLLCSANWAAKSLKAVSSLNLGSKTTQCNLTVWAIGLCRQS